MSPHVGDRSRFGRFRKLTAPGRARGGTYGWGGLVAGGLQCVAAVDSILTSTCFGSALGLALTSHAEDSKQTMFCLGWPLPCRHRTGQLNWGGPGVLKMTRHVKDGRGRLQSPVIHRLRQVAAATESASNY